LPASAAEMGGIVSRKKGTGDAKAQEQAGNTADVKQDIAERERQLALREEEIAEREAELEEWAARLQGRDGGADVQFDDSGHVGQGATQASPARRQGGAGPRLPRQSLLLHLAGGLEAEGVAERHGNISSVPTVPEVPDARKQATTLPKRVVQSRALRVFVCSSLEGVQAHKRLNAEVFPRLTNDAARRAVNLTFVDLHDELARSIPLGLATFDFEVHVLDLMLRELDECSLFIGLLGDCYGPPLGAKMCAAVYKFGHRWIEEEGLQGASMEDVLVRRAVRKDGLGMAAYHFHLFRSPQPAAQQEEGGARPGLEHARCASQDQRASWRTSVKRESQARGCLGALERLVCEYPLTVSHGLDDLSCAVFAGLLPLSLFPLHHTCRNGACIGAYAAHTACGVW
jgi:hypothetical protein